MNEQEFLEKAQAAYQVRVAQQQQQMTKSKAELCRLLREILDIDVDPAALDDARYKIAGVVFRAYDCNLFAVPARLDNGYVCHMRYVWTWDDVEDVLREVDEEQKAPTVYDWLSRDELNEAAASGRRFDVLGVHADGNALIRYTDVSQRNIWRELNKLLTGRLNALNDALRHGELEAAGDTIQACIDEIANAVWV